jgi:hypothetical protein
VALVPARVPGLVAPQDGMHQMEMEMTG